MTYSDVDSLFDTTKKWQFSVPFSSLQSLLYEHHFVSIYVTHKLLNLIKQNSLNSVL